MHNICYQFVLEVCEGTNIQQFTENHRKRHSLFCVQIGYAFNVNQVYGKPRIFMILMGTNFELLGIFPQLEFSFPLNAKSWQSHICCWWMWRNRLFNYGRGGRCTHDITTASQTAAHFGDTYLPENIESKWKVCTWYHSTVAHFGHAQKHAKHPSISVCKYNAICECSLLLTSACYILLQFYARWIKCKLKYWWEFFSFPQKHVLHAVHTCA